MSKSEQTLCSPPDPKNSAHMFGNSACSTLVVAACHFEAFSEDIHEAPQPNGDEMCNCRAGELLWDLPMQRTYC